MWGIKHDNALLQENNQWQGGGMRSDMKQRYCYHRKVDR